MYLMKGSSSGTPPPTAMVCRNDNNAPEIECAVLRYAIDASGKVISKPHQWTKMAMRSIGGWIESMSCVARMAAPERLARTPKAPEVSAAVPTGSKRSWSGLEPISRWPSCNDGRFETEKLLSRGGLVLNPSSFSEKVVISLGDAARAASRPPTPTIAAAAPEAMAFTLKPPFSSFSGRLQAVHQCSSLHR